MTAQGCFGTYSDSNTYPDTCTYSNAYTSSSSMGPDPKDRKFKAKVNGKSHRP